MMGIFSVSEKNSIVNEVIKKYPIRSVEYREFVEVIAGLRIINKVLGNDWYQKAKKDLLNKGSSQDEHPIAKYLKFDQPEKKVKLLNFANFLRNLYGKSNLEQRIQEYVRKERRASISSEVFDKLYSELKAANYFSDKGFQVEFLKEKKLKKTPDLQINAKDGSALVECKRKKEQSTLSIEGVVDSVLDANEQMVDATMPGIIFIDIPIRPSGPKIVKKFEETKLDNAYPQLKTVHYILLSGEWSIVQPPDPSIKRPGRAYTKSHMFSFQNKMSDLRLPPSIESTMLDITTSAPRSLLVD